MPPGWFEQATIWFVLLLTIANSSLQPSVLGEECELISRTVVGNQAYEDGLLRVWFALRKIWFMSSDHWRLSVMVMPKSMVSLAVVSMVPSMWYSLFGSNFLLEMFRVLHFGMPRLNSNMWLQLESWVVLLKRDLIRSLWNDLVQCVIWSQWEKLLVSQNLATLPSCLHVLINLHCTQQLQILVTALYVQCTVHYVHCDWDKNIKVSS